MNKIQKGFTLVELVIVIAILGILAAFLIPRFTGVSSKARVSVVQGIADSLRSAIAITHGQYLINGGSSGTVMLDGAQINLATNGYPKADGTPTGVLGTLNGTIALDSSGNTGTIGALQFSVVNNIVTLYPASAPNAGGAGCNVTYSNDTSNQLLFGIVNSTTSGC